MENAASTNSTSSRFLVTIFYFIAFWKRNDKPVWQPSTTYKQHIHLSRLQR